MSQANPISEGTATIVVADGAFGRDEIGDGVPRLLAGIAGVFTLAIGIVALAWPGPTLKVLGFLFGIYFVAWAIGLLLRAFSDHTRPGALRIADVVIGLLALVAGVLLIIRPGSSITVAARIFGLWWVLVGFLHIVAGILNVGGRAWNLAWGAVGIVAGLIILSWPQIGLGTLAIILGISFIAQGVLELLVAFAPRSSSA